MRYLADMRKEFGKIFTFFALSNAYLVICDPVVARRILSDSKTFIKGFTYSEYFSIVFGQGLVTSGEEKHKVDRAIFGKYFIRSNVLKHLPSINKLTKDSMEELNKHVQESRVQDMEEFFVHLSIRTFMKFAFSTTFDLEVEKQYCECVSRGSYLTGRLLGLGLPTWNIIPQVKELRNMKKIESDKYEPLINERKAALMRGEMTDVDDVMTAIINNGMVKQEAYDHITTMIAGGHDTTTFFCAYLCFLLAANPDAQNKLREEIISVVGATGDINEEQISNLPYLHKCMMETLRLYAVIPFVSRKASKEVYFKENNMTIRKNTEILIPIYLLNRDPELWDNASEFNPDRFDDKADFTMAKQGFFPFGYGTRTCIGNTLAQIEASVFMAHFFRRFKLKPVMNFKPNIIAGISLTTSNGIKVEVEPIM
jgi:cytochrome P450